ncbi:MAG TPA: hypothetical protein VIF62_28150 [Labilithrix sp.]
MRRPFFRAILAALLVAAAARAEPDFARAEDEDARGDFEDAVRDYDAVATRDPSSRVAPQAAARAAVLRAHAEGSFDPFRKLERVRRDPKLASDPAAIDALVHDADSFPPGLVRVEAWSLAAEAYARRLGRPADAVPLWKRVADDPASDPVLARHAASEAVALLVAGGDLDAAAAIAARDPALAREVARLVRRHRLHVACIGVLVLAGALAAAAWAAAARARRAAQVAAATRRIAPLALGYAAYVGAAGAVLASSYEGGTGRPFLAYGVALGPILLLARAWAAAGRRTRSARTARAVVCGAAALAAAFLVLEGVDATFLAGLGL